ncbi:MAG: M24 family metallopeptidase [bacterium]
MRDRIARVQRRLQELELHAMFLSAPASVRYVFGFTGSNAIGLITSDLSFFATDWRYRDQAQEEVRDVEILTAYRDLFGALKAKHAVHPGQRAGFEEQHLTYQQVTHLRKHFPEVKLAMTDYAIAKLAAEKSPAEQQLMRRAARTACAVWDKLLPQLRPGATEADITAELNYLARKCGSQSEPFEPIVASGPRAALPHGRSSARALQGGDMVVIDYGCVVEGYAADFTRTVAIGEPAPKLREAYHAVKEAGELAYAAMRPNMQATDLDAVARKHLTRYGLDQYFNHSLGHGLGLDVHMLPRIGPESKDVIPLHAVVAIEPGVYFPGEGGIRIEDDVLVTASGCEILTPVTRELICIE